MHLKIEQPRRIKFKKAILELFGSMRFAIALLFVIAIASIIGTVVSQLEPFSNYVNQFGPFWARYFSLLGLFNIYGSSWFLIMMLFLVFSLAICVSRNGPKIIHSARCWKEKVRRQNIQAFRYHDKWEVTLSEQDCLNRLQKELSAAGFRSKIFDKNNAKLLAAKRGGMSKWGYINVHLAIIVICIGGFLDSGSMIALQSWLFNKIAVNANQPITADLANEHRLSDKNPSFRGYAWVPEGKQTSTAILNRSGGYLLQNLPITIELKKFIVDYYSTGMPKLFASDIEVINHATGDRQEARVEVNKPFIYHGLSIYQSSFEDGGSELSFSVFPMQGRQTQAYPLESVVGESTKLVKPQQSNTNQSFIKQKAIAERSMAEGNKIEENTVEENTTEGHNKIAADEKREKRENSNHIKTANNVSDTTLELIDFRAINVENMTESNNQNNTIGVAKSSLAQIFDQRLGTGAKTSAPQNLRNVGPSFRYRLRSALGVIKEYHQYMMPVLIDNEYFFLAGTRSNSQEAFRYLRIPADDQLSISQWIKLRAALLDSNMRQQAALAFSQQALNNGSPELKYQLQKSAEQILSVYAGEEKIGKAGFAALIDFIEETVHNEDEKQEALRLMTQVLQSSMWELFQIVYRSEHQAPLAINEKNVQFLQYAITAISDNFYYDSPVFLQLDHFKQKQASVFQIAKTPGKWIVYIGSIMLVVGLFMMFYIRECRIWLWLEPNNQSDQTEEFKSSYMPLVITLGMTQSRQNFDVDKEFESIKLILRQATVTC